ncbi:putative voltage-gated ClC-type chloride channel ClcB [compost metagenome]
MAPLLTIGGAAGAILGIMIGRIFPDAGISVSMAALIGMSAMFTGASRAYLTSIAFALETTMQSHALLPLLAACTASYMISFFFMKNTIMTEKISRRGVATPDSYEPDILKKLTVAQVVKEDAMILSIHSTIKEVRELIGTYFPSESTFIVVDQEGHFNGTVVLSAILNTQNDSESTLETVLKKGSLFVKSSDSLEKALEVMLSDDHELIPVVSTSENVVTGVLSCKDIIAACRTRIAENKEVKANLSLNRQQFNVLAKRKKAVKMD